jgi:hypothetical protein
MARVKGASTLGPLHPLHLLIFLLPLLVNVSLHQWHHRLGHAPPVVRHILSRHNLPTLSRKLQQVCPACQQGKLHRLHFGSSLSVSKDPLDLLFLDVWGLAPTSSSNNKRYFLCIVDDFSKYMWVFTLSCKSEVTTIFHKFKLLVENFFSCTIKAVQTDGGGEFIPLKKILASNGISYRQTCPHTHHQNGSVEWRLRHVVDTGLALFSHAHVPFRYWDDAFDTACYLINRHPTTANRHKTPFELLFKTSPDYKLLKTFRCECWPYLRPYNSHKFSYHSKSYVFLGYSRPHSGYKCLDVSSGHVYIARHVIFHESFFPFQHVPSPTTCTPQQPPSFLPSTLWPPPHVPSPVPPSPAPASFPPPLPTTAAVASPTSTSISSPASATELSPSLAAPHRTHHMTTRSQLQIHKPKVRTDGTIKYPLPRALTVSLSSFDSEPTCFSEAVKHDTWRIAMTNEFNALLRNGTWMLVDPQPSMNIVGYKWVFCLKRKADGNIDKYKARLVAKGFHQQLGLDFGETYSPVIKPITIRAILSLAISYGWPIKQIDVSNAFLHGFLTKTVHMAQPPRFVHPQKPKVVRLLKNALYGLKQAPRAWFSQLSGWLLEFGFPASKADSSLFLYTSAGVRLMALVYVDDIILTGYSLAALDNLFSLLSAAFPIKDLGALSYFLGVEVSRTATGLHLSQQRYISNLLQRTNMTLAKPVTSPMSASTSLSKFDGLSLANPTMFRSTVGALQYLAITRPDIAFSVNKCSQFLHSPRDVHWTAVKHIFRYLKNTISYGLYLRPYSSLHLIAFSNADWAGCPDDRKSTSDIAPSLAKTFYLGPQSSSQRSLDPAPKLNTKLLLMPLPN